MMAAIHLFAGATIRFCALMRWDKQHAKPVYRQVNGVVIGVDKNYVSVRCQINGEKHHVWVRRDLIVA